MKIQASGDLSRIDESDVRRWLTIFASNVKTVVNGNLTFVDNVRCQIIGVTFSVANSSQAIAHTLRVIPTGYLALSSTAATQLYDGGQTNTIDTLYLSASAPAFIQVAVLG